MNFDHRKKSLLWYSAYTVGFQGDYAFRNPDPERRRLRLHFPLPAEQVIYDGLSVTVNGRPQPLNMAGNTIYVGVGAGPNEPIRLAVKYKSQGIESWRYSFGDKVNEVKDFTLKMLTNSQG